MQTLQQLSQQQQDQNQELGNKIEVLAQQLEDLKQELKIEQTRFTHQQMIDREFQQQKEALKKLMLWLMS